MMEKDLREKYADAETEYLKKIYELKVSDSLPYSNSYV